MWLLCALALCGLVAASFPIQQIRAAGAKFGGLIGSYWVPCDSHGNVLQNGNPGLDNNGDAVLIPLTVTPSPDYNYPVPDNLPPGDLYYEAFTPNPWDPGYLEGSNTSPELGVESFADNSVDGIGYYNPGNGSQAPFPSLIGSTGAEVNGDSLTAYFLWMGQEEVPETAEFLVTATAAANATVDYEKSGLTSGLFASSSASIANVNVLATASAPADDTNGKGNPTPATTCLAVPGTIHGDIASVTQTGSVRVATTNQVPWGQWINYPEGPGYAYLNGYTGTTATATAAAAAHPLYIQLNGGSIDGDGLRHVVIGQRCSASVVGLPENLTNATYSWGVEGNTFLSWTGSAPTTYPDWTAENPAWYWSDVAGSYNVSCEVSGQLPGGTFNTTLSTSVVLDEPQFNVNVTVGRVSIDGNDPWIQDPNPGGLLPPTTYPGIWVEPTDGLSPAYGMRWQTTMSGSPGNACFAQIVSVNESVTSANGTQATQQVTGLDKGFPTFGPFTAPTTPGQPNMSGDAPGVNLSSITSILIAEQFQTWLMFRPQGDESNTQWVPLGILIWNWQTTNDLPLSKPSGGWVPWTGGSPGSVNASTTTFIRTLTPPMWNTVITNAIL